MRAQSFNSSIKRKKGSLFRLPFCVWWRRRELYSDCKLLINLTLMDLENCFCYILCYSAVFLMCSGAALMAMLIYAFLFLRFKQRMPSLAYAT